MHPRSPAASWATSPTTLGAGSSGCPSLARVDQHLPMLRLALHDWAIAWDRRTGTAWLAARTRGRRRGTPGSPAAGRAGAARCARARRGSGDGRTGDARPGHRRHPASFVSGTHACRVARRRGRRPGRHRPRRDLPGQPHPPPRGPVRRRPVAGVPPPPHRRPRALRRLPGPRPVAGDRSATRPPLGLPGAVPGRGRGRQRRHRSDQGHPSRGAGPARRIAPWPGSSWPAARTTPRT